MSAKLRLWGGNRRTLKELLEALRKVLVANQGFWNEALKANSGGAFRAPDYTKRRQGYSFLSPCRWHRRGPE